MTTQTIRLSSPVDLITSLPYMLGFHPKRSIVLAGHLGPTPESLIARRFPDAAYFEQLLSKTQPPEAVLGPYDIPGLRGRKHSAAYRDSGGDS